MNERRARRVLVRAAQASIADGSKSFAMASRLFPRVTRQRAWLLYAWCRACDDLIDGQELGHGHSDVADPQAVVADIRARTEAAIAGTRGGGKPFDALALVIAECGIPARYPRELVAGFAMDADDFRPRREEDLYRYCYHVAGVVGVMMAIVMGVAPDDDAVLDRAADLGIAFQLANIARDVWDDAAAGRCYLPIDWLVEMDVPPGEHMKPAFRSQLAELTQRLADRAQAFEDSARTGTGALPFRAAWAVLAAAGIYGDIARTVAARGEHAWDHRVTTTRGAKLRKLAGAGFGAVLRLRRREVSRDGLWTRPAA